MARRCYWGLLLRLLMTMVTSTYARRGVSVPTFSLRPPLLEHGQYKTTYACEGRELRISCEEGGTIRLIRANYGRFSISICNDHGNLDWSVNCMSYRSFLIMQDRCSLKPSCGISVSSSTFGDPCPGTLKYLEVQYHCATETKVPTVASPTIKAVIEDVISSIPLDTTTVSPKNQSQISSINNMPSTTSFKSSSHPATSSPSVFALPSTTVTSTLDHSSKSSSAQTGMITTVQGTEMTSASSPPSLPSSTSRMPFHPIEDYCSPTFSRGIYWNWTKSGEEIFQKCPGGTTGVAKWKCGTEPVRWTPESPDLRDCKSLWLDNVRERMHDGDSIISVATELALMTLTKSLYSEDLKDTAELIQQTLSKAVNGMENFLDMWHKYHVLRELLQSLVQTVSNLLGDEQNDAWRDLSPEDRKKVISSLLAGLEESALLLADTSSQDGSFSLPRDNVLMSLQVLDARAMTSVKFPILGDLQYETGGNTWVRMEDSLVLPAQALLDSSRHGLVKVVFTAYNNVEDFLKPSQQILHFHSSQNMHMDNVSRIVNSRVIAASVGGHGMLRLTQPVLITFRHLKEENVTNPLCVFWDFHSREWSAKGCWLQNYNKTHTVCVCDHLTNFAVIMEVSTSPIPAPQHEVLRIVISVGCAIAVVCLLLTVIVLQILRNVRSDGATIHKNLFLCLLISEAVFMGGIDQTYNRIACAAVAGLLHYFFLAAFSWMFFESFQLYVMLIELFDTEKKRWVWYYVLAYGVPGVIVGVAAIIDPHSYGTEQYCWLRADNYFIFSFVGPAVGILFGGTVFLCIATCILCHHSGITTTIKGKEEAKLASIKSWIRWAVLLLCVLSLTWTSGLLYVSEKTVFLAYTFTALNSLQGLYILVFYCFRNEKVQEECTKALSNQRWLPACIYQVKSSEPHALTQLPASGTSAVSPASADHTVPQQLWNSPKDRNTTTTQKCTTPGPQSTAVNSQPAGEKPAVVSASEENKVGGDHDVASSPRWQSQASLSDVCVLSPRCVTAPAEWQHQQRHQMPYRHYSMASDSNGTFTDHIYESIDDDPGLSGDCEQNINGGQQQFPPAENYYGDHSDLSQHSSSSYSYDQRPLLITAVPTRHQPIPQVAYGTPKDCCDSPSPEGQKHDRMIYNSHRHKHRNRGSPHGRMHSPQYVCDAITGDVLQEIRPHVADSDSESWGPSLPDLLCCPADSAVVLAVLDGEKVISRLRPDDPQCQTHYKLSTYC